MPKCYSIHLRKKVISNIKKGLSFSEVSMQFQIDYMTVKRWLKMSQKGSLEDPKSKTRKPKKLDPVILKIFVEQNPDLTIKQIADHFKVWPQAVFYRLNKLKYTYKKRLSLQRKVSRKERKVS